MYSVLCSVLYCTVLYFAVLSCALYSPLCCTLCSVLTLPSLYCSVLFYVLCALLCSALHYIEFEYCMHCTVFCAPYRTVLYIAHRTVLYYCCALLLYCTLCTLCSTALYSVLCPVLTVLYCAVLYRALYSVTIVGTAVLNCTLYSILYCIVPCSVLYYVLYTRIALCFVLTALLCCALWAHHHHEHNKLDDSNPRCLGFQQRLCSPFSTCDTPGFSKPHSEGEPCITTYLTMYQCMCVFGHLHSFLRRPWVFSPRPRLRGTQGARVHTAVQVWVPGGLRGACSGHSKSRNLAINRGVAFRGATSRARQWKKHFYFSFFAFVFAPLL